MTADFHAEMRFFSSLCMLTKKLLNIASEYKHIISVMQVQLTLQTASANLYSHEELPLKLQTTGFAYCKGGSVRGCVSQADEREFTGLGRVDLHFRTSRVTFAFCPARIQNWALALPAHMLGFHLFMFPLQGKHLLNLEYLFQNFFHEYAHKNNYIVKKYRKTQAFEMPFVKRSNYVQLAQLLQLTIAI